MDTNRSSGTLISIDHRVICFGTHLAEQMMIGLILDRLLKKFEVFIHRRCERVVGGIVAVGIFVALEHGELRYDQAFVPRSVDQVLATGDLVAESAERCGDHGSS